MSYTCAFHPDQDAVATCTMCAKGICLEDRRIKIIEQHETMMCPSCFEEQKETFTFTPRMLAIAANLVVSIGVAIFILFV